MIKNKTNGKYYIGSSNDYERRWKQHIYELNTNTHQNKYLQNAWNKNGESSFCFKVIEYNVNEENKYEREQFYIDTLDPFYKNGYNISKTARGGGTYGDRIHTSIHSNDEISEIKKMMSIGSPFDEIHTRFPNLNKKNYYQIRRCDTWKGVASIYNEDILKNNVFRKPSGTWNEENILEIIDMYENGDTFQKIANIYNLNRDTISSKVKKYYIDLNEWTYVCEKCGKTSDKDVIKYNREYRLKKGFHRKYCKQCANK